MNTIDNLGKFDSRSDEGIFTWLFRNVQGIYRVHNCRTCTMEKFIHGKFNNYKPDKKLSELEDYYGLDMQVQKKKVAEPTLDNLALNTPLVDDPSLEKREKI